MAGDRTILDEPHAQSLELLAARALADGEVDLAFRLSDRRCRIAPPVEPHCYVLRAEAARRMGDESGALDDIERAVERAPDDVAANRRLLAWGDRDQRIQAARALLREDDHFDILRAASKLLLDEDETAVARLRVFDDSIEGFAAWRRGGAIEITIADENGATTAVFEPDEAHPLAGDHAATRIALRRPRSATPQSIVASSARGVFKTMRAAPNAPSPATRRAARRDAPAEPGVTIIVPVYADYEATRTCLDGLDAALRENPRHRAILIDDASPDPRIVADLFARKRGRVEVLTNARNLGFIGAINRALERVDDGDVILLNADTIVPPGFIDRLAAAARSSDDIGAVIPLSNNGEFTSFPLANVANPLGDRDDVERIDRIAACVNSGIVVDIPSGIGFCLYITRRCLDAVGPLCEDYERGYLEDVDYCLRARERGFRSVCAASVYVGHAGTKSFRGEKRALVVKNLKTLERRFPSHRGECLAFTRADPLRSMREAIERAQGPSRHPATLLVAASGDVADIARARAARVVASGGRAIIARSRSGPRGPIVALRDASGASPQSVEFSLDRADERLAMLAFLRDLRIAEAEILDAGKTPAALAKLLLELGAPLSVVLADAEGLLPNVAAHMGAAGSTALGGLASAMETAPWRDLLGEARRILAPGAQAAAVAARAFPERVVDLDEADCPRRPPLRRGDGLGESLGILLIGGGAAERRLLDAVLDALRDAKLSIVVIGEAPPRLMRRNNVFVTGGVLATDLERVARAYRLGRVFVNLPRPLFGHPLEAAARSLPLPLAAFDWSMDARKSSRGDLALDPLLASEALAETLSAWAARR